MATSKSAKGGNKKVTTTIVEEALDDRQEEVSQVDPAPAAPIIPEVLDQDPGDYDIRKFFESFGGDDNRVKIYKFDAQGRSKFINECDVESATETFLQENWGEGKYKLALFSAAKDYMGSKTILVGPGKNKPLMPEEPEKETPQPSAAPSAESSIFTMMMESMKFNNQLLVEMFKNKDNGHNNTKDLAEIVSILQANKGGNHESISPTKLIADFMPVVKEFIALASRGGSPERTWTDTVKDMAAEIPGVIKAFGMVRNMQGTIPGAAPVNGGSTTTEAANPREGAVEKLQIEGLTQQDIMKLQLALDFLKSRARGGKDPQTFIFYVLDTLDDDQSLAIAKLLDRSYEEIAILDPEILSNVYRPWFEKFFGGLKDALSQRDDPDGQGGDDSDTADNEGPGPGGVSVGSVDQG